MNLYRSKGHIWTGTQADAKAANDGDKNFEHIEVPTDKAGLMAFLNEMEKRVAGSDFVVALEEADEAPEWPEEVFDRAEVRVEGVVVRQATGTLTQADCPACNRSKKQAKIATNSQAFVSIAADLEDVQDYETLDRISNLVLEQRERLRLAQ